MASESRTWKLADLARELGGDLQGNPDTVICGIASPDDAGPGQIAVVPGPQVAPVPPNRASAVVLSQTAPAREGNVIRVAHTGTALIALLRMFSVPDACPPQGVDVRACVDPTARLGDEPRVAPGVFIGAHAVIGNRVTLHPNVYVGDACEIGDDVELLPNVTIHSRTRIGRRVRIRAGTVIGGDGFGYVRDEAGVQHRVPHVGNVEIEDDVEIGANCTVDRATMGATRIREGTKVDNLVHIAHNVTVGRHGCLVAQVGISGSVRIGDYCTLAGQAGVSDHVTLADHVTVGAKSGVLRDLTPGRWLGAPAIPAEQAAAAYHLLGKLPDLRRRIQALEERLAQLQRTAPPGEGSA